MKSRQLEKLGVPHTLATMAKWQVSAARKAGLSPQEVRTRIQTILSDPDAHLKGPHFADLARAVSLHRRRDANWGNTLPSRTEPVPWRQWGTDLDQEAIAQMQNACMLPVAVAGALMPDAHIGYGLPIGGVLGTKGAVIPYAVGVDIACRMKLSVLDLPPRTLESQGDRLANAIEAETRFGLGASFAGRGRHHSQSRLRDHPVLDERDWSLSPLIRSLRDKAHAQLGTSGSGNHFVEFGTFTVDDVAANDLGLPGAGVYLALLSHSGSRGPGSTIAGHYSRLAMQLHPRLDRPMRHLAWLDLDTHEGQEYWAAMQLMGKFASANHALIHQHIARHLGAQVLLDIENHHNFAWKERHRLGGEEREIVVHRKGATPAGAGVLGIIPGSMASPAYVVRGKGEPQSLNSASHGAGRTMSRTQARQTYRWAQVRDHLERRGVRVLSAGLDEVPFVYKDIDQVMAHQQDLVSVLGRFDPRLVKMAPEGERAED